MTIQSTTLALMLRDKYRILVMILYCLFVMFLVACNHRHSEPPELTGSTKTEPTKVDLPKPEPKKPTPRPPEQPKKPTPPIQKDNQAVIINILLDLSGSIKKPQFEQANAAADRVLNLCHERAKLHPGERADFLSVNWFGSHRRYEGTEFINCSNFGEMLKLSLYLDLKEYKPLGDTAIYSAILQAANESIEREKTGSGKYLKVIIVVTDGKDTNSPQEVKGWVRTLFPNPLFFLAVIGVGPKANVNEFKDIADRVDNIKNFDDLAVSIMAAVELSGILSQ